MDCRGDKARRAVPRFGAGNHRRLPIHDPQEIVGRTRTLAGAGATQPRRVIRKRSDQSSKDRALAPYADCERLGVESDAIEVEAPRP